MFSRGVASRTFILCRQPGGIAKQIDEVLCSYEDTRWVLALREDSSRGGTEYALEPGPVPELPPVPREVLFRLWLQSPDGRLVRSMISKVEQMRVLVDATERQIEEAQQALSDATVYIGQLDGVSSNLAATAQTNSQTARVLADVLFVMKRVPYVGPVASVFNRVLNNGAKVLEKGRPKVLNARTVFNRVGGAMDTLQDGMLSAFVILRPPLDALDAVKEGLKNLQACAFFDGGVFKENAVRGVIKKVISAVDLANAGMDSIRGSLQVINGVKPDIILNTGLRPIRNILNGMRPVTNIMRSLRFIADIFTYPIRFNIPIIGRVSFKLIDIARTIGRVIGIIKSIPFVGWIVGWIESAVDSAIRAIFGRINLPLPSFNRDFTGPVRRARDALIAARDRVLEQARAMELELQGAFTGLIPGDIDFNVDLDVNQFIPDELSDLPCVSEECAFQLPVLGPVVDDMTEARDFLRSRLAVLDRSLIQSTLLDYLRSLNGCNETFNARVPLAKFLPENIRVESCNLNDPEVELCIKPTFSRGDLLANLSRTVSSLFEFTPSQRRMLRRALDSCDGNYCFESLAVQIIGFELPLSLGDFSNFVVRQLVGQSDRFPFTFSPTDSVFFEVDAIIIVAADYAVKLSSKDGEVVPEDDFDVQITIVPSLGIERISKPWIVMRKLIRSANGPYFKTLSEFKCFELDKDERADVKQCDVMLKLGNSYFFNAKWSKGNRVSIFGLQKLLVYPPKGNGEPGEEPGFLEKRIVLDLAKRQTVPLLRRHVQKFKKLLKIEAKRTRLKLRRFTRFDTETTVRTAPTKFALSPWRLIELDEAFYSIILRPDGPLHPDTQIEDTILQYGNALSFEFSLDNTPLQSSITPRAFYIALAFPMNGPLLLDGAPKPRIALSLSTRSILEFVGCSALRLDCFVNGTFSVVRTVNPDHASTCKKVRDLCNFDTTARQDIINSKAIKIAFAYGIGDPLRGKALGIQ